jgi:hypothetical protein
MTAKERILQFLKHKKVGQNAFEQKVGIANGYISHNKGSLGSDIIAKIANAYPELNVCWLVIGKGEMLISKDKSAPTSAPLAQLKAENDELRGQVKLLKELLKEKEKENVRLLQEIGALSLRANEEAGEVGRVGAAANKKRKFADVAVR